MVHLQLGERESELYCSESNEDTSPKHTREIEQTYDIDQNIASENEFEIAKALRILGEEYGGTSSRPRRIGLFDLVQLKYAIRMNGVDELVITKTDMLADFARTKFKAIPVVNKYIFKGREIDFIPASATSYYKVKGERLMLNGFGEDIQNIKKREDLPKNVIAFIEYIQNYSGVKVVGIGVGPERDQFVNID
jgi:adenylosuccinate synthase